MFWMEFVHLQQMFIKDTQDSGILFQTIQRQGIGTDFCTSIPEFVTKPHYALVSHTQVRSQSKHSTSAETLRQNMDAKAKQPLMVTVALKDV